MLCILTRLLIVWQIVRIDANEIRLGISEKANGADVALALDQGLQYTVHSIHHAAVTRQYDGMLKLRLIDEARMLGNRPAGHRLAPVWLVELADARDWHQLGLEVLS